MIIANVENVYIIVETMNSNRKQWFKIVTVFHNITVFRDIFKNTQKKRS